MDFGDWFSLNLLFVICSLSHLFVLIENVTLLQRLSEMSCLAVTHLLMLGKSIISSTNKIENENADDDILKINWPEEPVEKAKVIRTKAQIMTGYVEAVSNSFITGWLLLNLIPCGCLLFLVHYIS